MPIVASKGLITFPAVTTRPPLDWLEWLGSLGFRGSPQFGCIAGHYHRESSWAVPTSHGRTPGFKAATCGNFSDTSSFKSRRAKGSIGHAFTVCIRTENQNQMSFYPFVPHEISVLVELILGHLRYLLTDVPPQPNSPPDNVFHPDRRHRSGALEPERGTRSRLRLME